MQPSRSRGPHPARRPGWLGPCSRARAYERLPCARKQHDPGAAHPACAAADGGLRGAHGARIAHAPAAALPVDRRVRGLQLPRARARDRRASATRELALRLVEQVHRVLGRHRADDRRSGLDQRARATARARPTRRAAACASASRCPSGGADEPFDERLEWERDGQYFHYLTQVDARARSGGARDRASRCFNRWARELAEVGASRLHRTSRRGGRGAWCWKMSIDLSRPLVASMGQHDPLDGLITCVQLQSDRRARCACASSGPSLAEERDGLRGDDRGRRRSHRRSARPRRPARRRVPRRAADPPRARGSERSARPAARGGARRAGALRAPERPGRGRPRRGSRSASSASSVGLHALERLSRLGHQRARGPHARPSREEARLLEALRPPSRWARRSTRSGSNPENRAAGAWAEHEDLNAVTLATSLCPEGFLEIPPVT